MCPQFFLVPYSVTSPPNFQQPDLAFFFPRALFLNSCQRYAHDDLHAASFFLFVLSLCAPGHPPNDAV